MICCYGNAMEVLQTHDAMCATVLVDCLSAWSSFKLCRVVSTISNHALGSINCMGQDFSMPDAQPNPAHMHLHIWVPFEWTGLCSVCGPAQLNSAQCILIVGCLSRSRQDPSMPSVHSSPAQPSTHSGFSAHLEGRSLRCQVCIAALHPHQ